MDEQIGQVRKAIADLEEQRSVLGDSTVEAALMPLREKLTELEVQEKALQQNNLAPLTRKRKLVTLLYMDVVDSTAMTQGLDPEDTMEIMEKAILRLAAPIEVHGGHITRYTGDGFKAIFGDPVAREDDPEQAIRAGLEILEVSNGLAQEIEKEWDIEGFQLRIGIDTGLAAIGGQTEAEDTVKGRVVNLAVRIESAAPPGSLLISHNTYRHVRGVFTVEPQEPIKAKGFTEPVPVYLVKEIKPRAFRVQTRGVEDIETGMIGRESDLKYLQDTLMTALEEGEGQVVTISGEAGVGKSRLLYEFENWIELMPPSQDVRFFQGRGRQEAQGLPYSLLRDLFAFRFQILDDDSGEQARQKIETGFCDVFGLDEAGIMRAHILGQLLGFDFRESSHLKGVLDDPEQLRNRGVMYLIQYFQALSLEKPAVIFLEDIHWGDDSSLDVVSRIGEFTPQHPILFVCAARPWLFERRPYWGEGQTYHTRIELRPLSKRESRQLVGEILKLAADIPAELRELVVQGAEGNPFYTEELIKMLIENGVIIPGEETWQIDLTRLEEVDIPSTLAGVLQARLDSLPTYERIVLQQASVVGRLFWDRIVAYIQSEDGNGDDPQLIPTTLNSLRIRELIYRHEESVFKGAVEYLFKHDVLREVTYQSVIKRLRTLYHGLVADWLIANCGDRIGEYHVLIAKHLLKANRNDQACSYFTRAGEIALASFANQEAEIHFRQAMDLTQDISLRADLLAGLGKALYKQGQPGEAIQIWHNAIDLYRDLGDRNHLGDLYSRISWVLWYTDDYLKARDICLEGLKLLEGGPDSPGYARLLAEAGRASLFCNDLDQVLPYCKHAIAMAESVGELQVQAEANITLALYEDDPQESLNILMEVADQAQTNGLLRTAARAYNNIGAKLDDISNDLHSARSYYMRAVDIFRQIGDVESLLFTMINIYQSYIDLGELQTVEGDVENLLRAANVPDKRIHNFLQENRPYLLIYRGDWFSALEIYTDFLDNFQERGNLERMSDKKWQIAYLLLELNWLGIYDDLSRAKKLLLENIDDDLGLIGSNSGLVFIYIQQGRLADARSQLSKTKGIIETSHRSAFFNIIQPWIEFELAVAEESWEQAVTISEAILEKHQQSGYHYNSARWLINLGDALKFRNKPGDIDIVRETYQQSLDMFTEMGAPGYIKVLEERLVNL